MNYLEVIVADVGEICSYNYESKFANRLVVFENGTLAFYNAKDQTCNYFMNSPIQFLVKEFKEATLETTKVVTLDSSVLRTLLDTATVGEIVELRENGLI